MEGVSVAVALFHLHFFESGCYPSALYPVLLLAFDVPHQQHRQDVLGSPGLVR